jgi:glucosylceramidase
MASHTSIRRLVSSVALAALLAGCGSSAVAPSTEPPPITGPLVQTWVTTADKSKLLLLETGLGFADRVPAAADIAVNPAVRYQTMVGFGASITDATAWLMMNRMSAEQRNALLQELFGRGPNGIGFDYRCVGFFSQPLFAGRACRRWRRHGAGQLFHQRQPR